MGGERLKAPSTFAAQEEPAQPSLCQTSAQGLPRGSPVPFVRGWTAAGMLSTCTHGTHACSIPTPGVAGDPKPLPRLHQTPSHV